MKQRIFKIIRYLDKLKVQKYRRNYVQPDLKGKLACNSILNLSRDELNAVTDKWGGYKYDIKWVQFYKSIPHEGNVTQFIPDDLFYSVVDYNMSDYRMANYFDDKNLYDLYFYDIDRPGTVLRHIEGIYMDAAYNHITKDQSIQICKGCDSLICKPTLSTCGGKGIGFWDKSQDESVLDELLARPNIIVQRILTQHSVLSAIHAQSLNTIRVMTMMIDGECRVLSSVLRMGANGNKVDNVSSGGIACGINADGRLKDKAFDNKGRVYLKHPQGTAFTDVVIPNFEEFTNLATKLAYRLCRISKLISWDFSVSAEGHPVIIEANISWGELDFHQMCNGPIFGEDTDRIWNWVKEQDQK